MVLNFLDKINDTDMLQPIRPSYIGDASKILNVKKAIAEELHWNI